MFKHAVDQSGFAMVDVGDDCDIARFCHNPILAELVALLVMITDEYLRHNVEYAASHPGALPLPPSKQIAIVACMDARLDVYRMLGIALGEAHVIRNAGGVVTDDVIRSLVISQRLLGTREIILIHHTDCGMLTFSDDAFKREIQNDTGIKPTWSAEAFADLDEDLRMQMARIQASPFLISKQVRGFVFDIATGLLREVV